MRNLIIIFLTVLVVIAGAFLPEILLKHSALPEVNMNYQQVAVTSESSSDYTWRMERMAEHYFGEGENILTTYISEIVPGEEENDAHVHFLDEAATLTGASVLPEQLLQLLEAEENYRIRYYYVFDSQSVNGFRIAEFVVEKDSWHVVLAMDVESGKLARVEYGGRMLRDSISSAGWYDVLHGYANYLGLSTASLDFSQPSPEPDNTVREYYNSCTAERLLSRMASGGTAWMELRVLQEPSKVNIAVYNGGK